MSGSKLPTNPSRTQRGTQARDKKSSCAHTCTCTSTCMCLRNVRLHLDDHGWEYSRNEFRKAGKLTGFARETRGASTNATPPLGGWRWECEATKRHARRRQEPQDSAAASDDRSCSCERPKLHGVGSRAFNKVLRFFPPARRLARTAAHRLRSPGMSNGYRGIACRFTHEANFPAYRRCNISRRPSAALSDGAAVAAAAASRCSYFTPRAPFYPRILRPFSFPFSRLSRSPARRLLFACRRKARFHAGEPDFACLRCAATRLLVSAVLAEALFNASALCTNFRNILPGARGYKYPSEMLQIETRAYTGN